MDESQTANPETASEAMHPCVLLQQNASMEPVLCSLRNTHLVPQHLAWLSNEHFHPEVHAHNMRRMSNSNMEVLSGACRRKQEKLHCCETLQLTSATFHIKSTFRAPVSVSVKFKHVCEHPTLP